ncbi:N-acetylglucosamine-6-phosphate deacetylase [Terrihalobacillus insolitus]|uniref:N-acetylglucosamine-6-phosphate deacetylase n=1 Tax=Terrihalobacillus insolitus TaxID=2950438 RepID=UPI002341E6AC|nr:N-acetylglucosamine-6-phosphate deacetylase [Terrihalobacillus insolitus]MDC3412181.1 N-acetylglucosamine-6-phosphate deacetylase [Terrihalobacillus insolitus]
MYYLHGDVILDGKIVRGQFVEIVDGLITYVGELKRQDYPVDEVENGYICPGFVDIHIHGVDGVDLSDDQMGVFEEIAVRLPKYGVTAFLATSRTSSKKDLVRFLGTASRYRDKNGRAARLLGTHIEGPWISKKYKGAQPEEYIRRLSWEDVDEIIDPYKDVVKKVTIAPEELDDYTIISCLARCGIQVSAGHTNASLDDIGRAMEYGLNQLTHTFNAMSMLHHREPGVVAAALYYSELICELITDGLHVHPKVIELLYRVKGKKGVALISDCTGYNDLEDGEYFLRNKHLVKKENKVTLKSGNLAGSALTLDKGVGYVVNECGIPLEDAVYMATQTPLEAIRENDRLGRIDVGYKADIVILDEKLEVERTIINGEIVFERGQSLWGLEE